MSIRYKFADNTYAYFTTSTIVDWCDIFTREMNKKILLDSIRYCQTNQGLIIHAWVLMTNHFHSICSCKDGKDIGLIWRNIKSFTAMELIDAIIKNPIEPKREHWLYAFEKAGQESSSNFRFKIWQHENHPVMLDSTEKFNDRLNYIHWNPVKAGFVTEPAHWLYSSAVDYFTDRKGLLELSILEGG